MRRPETPEEHAVFREAWSEVFGRTQTHVLHGEQEPGIKSLYTVAEGNGVVNRHKHLVFERLLEGDFNSEIEVPEKLIQVGMRPHYIGYLWMGSKTFECFPWYPLAAWLRDIIKVPKLAREFSFRRGHIVLPIQVAREVTQCQMRIGADETGKLHPRGAKALEGRWPRLRGPK